MKKGIIKFFVLVVFFLLFSFTGVESACTQVGCNDGAESQDIACVICENATEISGYCNWNGTTTSCVPVGGGGNDPTPTKGAGGGNTAEALSTTTLYPIPNNVSKKCNCAGAQLVNKCGLSFYNLTNIKYKICTFNLSGPDICTHYRAQQNGNTILYQVESCTSNPTATPGGPTVTPGGLTPTSNPSCVCTAAGACSNQCNFTKDATITTYSTPIKCNVPVTFFQTAPVAVNKNDWCRRPQKTKGDANGDDKVSLMDYFYYVQAKGGGKVPPSVNPDFNGDNAINAEDRAIIIKSL